MDCSDTYADHRGYLRLRLAERRVPYLKVGKLVRFDCDEVGLGRGSIAAGGRRREMIPPPEPRRHGADALPDGCASRPETERPGSGDHSLAPVGSRYPRRQLAYLLRHSVVSWLLDGGASIEAVADVLGDGPRTPYRHYRHNVRPVAESPAPWLLPPAKVVPVSKPAAQRWWA